MSKEEFREIAHSGGKVIIRVGPDPQGRRGYQQTWTHQRPVASAIFAIYALPQGVPVCTVPLGGIGSPIPAPPIPECYMLFISSDSEGKFGHHCPACKGYWRDEAGTQYCPYCGHRDGAHAFLTDAQHSSVEQYCGKMREVLQEDKDGEYVIDMDAVADAAGTDLEKPPFYYAEESQQNKFKCNACGSYNDILGVYGYCSRCGTRNDFQEPSEKVISAIRDRINADGQYEACVKDAVSAFDSVTGQYVKQLLERVPITQARRNKLDGKRFQNLQQVREDLDEIFGIDIQNGIGLADFDFAKLMFHRRHVYEHKGGEADEKYIADSGDSSVRPKQALRETKESAHRISSLVVKMCANLHRGFHELTPVDEGPIKQHEKWKPRTSSGS
jgi:hypothetical protein